MRLMFAKIAKSLCDEFDDLNYEVNDEVLTFWGIDFTRKGIFEYISGFARGVISVYQEVITVKQIKVSLNEDVMYIEVE